MARAAYEHHRAKWLHGHPSEIPPAWGDLDEYDKEKSIAEMRAALRALAEMEPTEAMEAECPNFKRAQAYILAAAKEGESNEK